MIACLVVLTDQAWTEACALPFEVRATVKLALPRRQAANDPFIDVPACLWCTFTAARFQTDGAPPAWPGYQAGSSPVLWAGYRLACSGL